MPKSPTVLVIDDDQEIRYSLDRVLGARGYKVMGAASGEEGIETARSEAPQVILLDNRMGGMSGMEALQHLKADNPTSMVILMTAFGTTQTAIEAMKYGAFDYIIKPFDLKKILGLVEGALTAQADLNRAVQDDYQPLINSEDYKEGIVGDSEPMQEVFKVIGQVAASDVTVMITGESGTGKELVARCIAQHSHRSSQPFVAVNCAAVPENLIESELFGHEKGAFTGATAQKAGKFEICDGGTLFLDEVGDMSLPTQTKMLRAIQEGEIQRVGGTQTIKVDVRLICATNKDLEQMVQAAEFREDLYYRLNVVRLRLPALRERKSDIPALVDFMLQRLGKNRKARAKKVSPDVLAIFQQHNWPGNVRELENVIYRSSVVAKGETVLMKDLPEDLLSSGPGLAPALNGEVPTHTSEPSSGVTPDTSAANPVIEAHVDNAVEPQSVLDAAADPFDSDADVNGSTTAVVPQRELTLANALDAVYARVREETEEPILQTIEREMITRALAETGGNQVKTSALLGITRATLRKRIEHWGLKG
ncbi:MAG: sigma-54-dependent transcriptional regulator [Opitutales bacterium]